MIAQRREHLLEPIAVLDVPLQRHEALGIGCLVRWQRGLVPADRAEHLRQPWLGVAPGVTATQGHERLLLTQRGGERHTFGEKNGIAAHGREPYQPSFGSLSAGRCARSPARSGAIRPNKAATDRSRLRAE